MKRNELIVFVVMFVAAVLCFIFSMIQFYNQPANVYEATQSVGVSLIFLSLAFRPKLLLLPLSKMLVDDVSSVFVGDRACLLIQNIGVVLMLFGGLFRYW